MEKYLSIKNDTIHTLKNKPVAKMFLEATLKKFLGLLNQKKIPYLFISCMPVLKNIIYSVFRYKNNS